MSKQIIYLISFVFVLGVALTSTANAQDPSLVGWWKLDDEGTGTVLDYSGNGRDGTLIGSPQFVPGVYGQAMEFHGDPDYVNIDGYKGLLGGHAFSITAWIKTTGNGEIVGWGNNVGTERIEFRVSEYRLRTEHGSGNRQGDTFVSDNEWHHVALTVEENATISYPEVILYVDGEDDTRSGTDSDAFNIVENFDVTIARQYSGSNRWFIGLIDDVRIYDQVLSADEIRNLAILPTASAPLPADGLIHPETWVSLSWSPGADAISHDVYFGDNFDDVNVGAEATFQGNQAGTDFTVGFSGFPYPDGLVPGTTYYWRVDEVEADGTTIQKGDVWSFTVPTINAADLDPLDGARFVDPNVTLTWTPGLDGVFHYIYLGDNFDDVNNATGAPPHVETTYTPGTLEFDKVYYWRVDEYSGRAIHKGNVWSFRTMPFIPTYDPDLVGWWKLDDDGSGIVVDSSGYGHHGTLNGNPQWVTGYDGDALELGSGDYVRMDGYKGIMGTNAFTITAWIKTATNGQIISWGSTGAGQRAEFRVNGSRLRCDTNGGNVQADTNLIDDEWHHVAVTVKENATISSGDVTFYLDGQDDTRTSSDTDVFNITSNFDVKISQMYDLSSSRWFVGLIDDVRIYSKVLTPEEIEKTTAGDPRLSWDPKPANGSIQNIDVVVPLSWSSGDFVASHDVYFGTDKIDVANANASDTTGIYRGRQNLGSESYSPPERLEYNQSYYWRIDEYNTDETISRGRIWSFTVADFIVLDDFEDYNDYPPDRIFETWIDGWDDPSNGSTVGYLNPVWALGEHFVETNIVHGGAQAMPFLFDNNFIYSQATMTLSSQRDWTRQGVKSLSLWFRGHPESFSSFTEGPAGTYTMTVRSEDIWGQSDHFHYVFKQLSGPGSIVAKVENATNTSNSAKIGVMIRDTLAPDSKHAFTFIRPDGGVRFNRRTEILGDTTNSVENGLAFPHWVKLERDTAGTFTASHSADGINWVPVNDTNLGTSANVQMNTVVYVGLALSSNNIEETCEAVFSNVSTTGSITGQWQSQDIDIPRNDIEPMYVALANSGGSPAVVYHPDPKATQIGTWTEWNIDLQEFADRGINLANVDKLSIGFGDKDNLRAGGAGTMYFDDIRLYRPRPEPEP